MVIKIFKNSLIENIIEIVEMFQWNVFFYFPGFWLSIFVYTVEQQRERFLYRISRYYTRRLS
jgi:Na+/H+ antiporter NhaC